MRLPSAQRIRRTIMVLLAVVALIGVNSPALAGDSGDRSGATGRGTYLALGDSVPFGFFGNAGSLYLDPDNFVGYPELLADDLDLRLLNASCPGETTDSFVDAEARSNGCQNSLDSPIGYRDQFPLHVDYEGSQLDYAVETLDDGPRVRLVTLQLGANDLFVCFATGQCSTPAGLQALGDRVEENLDDILEELRDEGEYRGRIAVVPYYALDYTDPVGVAAIQVVNEAMIEAAEDNGAVVADGFGAFRSRALEAGGSSIAAGLVRPDDVHPTAEGHRLLARAVERAVGH